MPRRCLVHASYLKDTKHPRSMYEATAGEPPDKQKVSLCFPKVVEVRYTGLPFLLLDPCQSLLSVSSVFPLHKRLSGN